MEITEVKVYPVRDKKLRAFVSIVLDGSFMVNDIKVIQGKEGFFISMPSRRKKNGRFKDIAHPLNQETRQAMEERIVAEYQRVADGGEEVSAMARETAPEGAHAADTDGPEREQAAEEPAGQSPAQEEDQDKSLEEVAEHHLSDSYWTT